MMLVMMQDFYLFGNISVKLFGKISIYMLTGTDMFAIRVFHLNCLRKATCLMVLFYLEVKS